MGYLLVTSQQILMGYSLPSTCFCLFLLEEEEGREDSPVDFVHA